MEEIDRNAEGEHVADESWVEFALLVRAEQAAAKASARAKARKTPFLGSASRDKKQAPVIACYVFADGTVCLEIRSDNR
jgi:hypothetical protein